MAAEVSAAEGAITRGAGVVAQSRGELLSELNVLRGKLESLRGAWAGQGAVAFAALMERWNGDANTIINALDEFEANLTSTEAQYTATDDTTSSTMTNLTSRLGSVG